LSAVAAVAALGGALPAVPPSGGPGPRRRAAAAPNRVFRAPAA